VAVNSSSSSSGQQQQGVWAGVRLVVVETCLA
jgi:hypothetical protein